MRRLAITCAIAVSAFATGLLAAAPAAAAPDNAGTLHITLDCGGQTIAAVFQLSSADAFHVVGTSSNFLWKSLDYVTPDGQTGRIERGVNGAGHELVTCTYTGAVSGNQYTATGFFTR